LLVMVALASAPVFANTITLNPNDFVRSSADGRHRASVNLRNRDIRPIWNGFDPVIRSTTTTTTPTFSSVYYLQYGVQSLNGALHVPWSDELVLWPSVADRRAAEYLLLTSRRWILSGAPQYLGSLRADCSQELRCLVQVAGCRRGRSSWSDYFGCPTNSSMPSGFLTAAIRQDHCIRLGLAICSARLQCLGSGAGWCDATWTTARRVSPLFL